MALADTASLLVALELKDRFSQPMGRAASSLSAAEKASQGVQGALKGVGTLAGGAGDAFNHLTGRLGQLAGALGVVGLGGGLIGVVSLLKDSVGEARAFGSEVSRLAAVTGLTAEKTSELASVFHHFGIEADTALTIAGLAEKNLFKLGGTAKGAADFQAKYGLSLVDASGKLLDFNELILASAKYFNDPLVPAAQKAAGLAAIFGRNWQAVVPVLKANADGISAVEAEAKRMGLTLGGEDLKKLGALKEATRNWTTALSGLKLQIGLALIPTLTDFTKKLTGFLTSTDEFGHTGSQRIVAFLKDVISWGQKAADFIANNIVPGIQAAIDNWNKIPLPIRNLLFKGFAANSTVSFLLGFNPVSIATQAAGAVATKIAGTLAGGIFSTIGGKIADLVGSKAIPQLVEAVAPIPVFVVNQVGGLPTGGAPGSPIVPPGETPATAGRWTRLFGLLGKVSLVLTDVALWIEAGRLAVELGQQIEQGNQHLVDTVGKNAGFTREGIAAELVRVQKQLDDNNLNPLFRATIAPTLEASKTYLQGLLSKSDAQLAAMGGIASKLDPANQKLAQIASLAQSERNDPKAKPLTAAELVQFLSKTPVVGPTGRKSILEESGNPRRGDDPFGESALGLFERTSAAILKTPLALEQVKGHITELRDVEKFYLARGDTVAAGKTQTVIEKIEALIGITDPKDAQMRAEIKRVADNASRHAASDRVDAASTQSHLRSLIAGYQAIHSAQGIGNSQLSVIAAKKWENINNNSNFVNVNVTANTSIAVDTLTRTFISSAWATSGRAPGSLR